MNKNISFFFLSLFVLAFLGCTNNDESDSKETTCIVSSDYHFKGNVNGILKSFVKGSKNYQTYSGGEIEGDEAPKGRLVFGMDTWPINIGDETILFRTPKVNTEDAAAIATLFTPGELNLFQRREFKLSYSVLLDVDNYRAERLEGRFDENSSIQICSFQKIQSLGGSTEFKVRMIFNCQLYSLDGELKGEIKDGKITGRIYVLDEKE